MLIAQITDTHIGYGDRARVNADRLAQVVAAVAAHDASLVVVTGDLTDCGNVDAYRLFKRLLEPLAGRLLLLLGNHDKRDAFISVFEDVAPAAGYIHTAHTHSEVRVVTLDTLDEGRETAAFCKTRAAWLETCLRDQPDTPTLIALHHPPVRTGVEWIDVNADGRWSKRLEQVVSRHAQVIGLMAGHAHQPIATVFAGRPLIIAPSVAFAVAHDTRPLSSNTPDGRALIVDSRPGYALHRWTGERLVSWFGTVDDAPVVIRFNRDNQAMIADRFTRGVAHDI